MKKRHLSKKGDFKMKKGFKILGMIISIGLVVFGILVLTGVFTDSISYPGNAPSGYDSGYAIFGADFYNYVCNNSAEAANAAAAAAYNTGDLIGTVTNGFGALILALGLLGFCFFGMMPTGTFKVQTVSPVSINAPVAEPACATEPVTDFAEEAASTEVVENAELSESDPC
jgi:hypothetical protein